MEKEEYDARLHDHNERNTDHKLEVLCLMTDEEHSNKHCDRSSERGEEKERFFGCTKLNAVLFRDLLVVDTYYDRNNRDDENIS